MIEAVRRALRHPVTVIVTCALALVAAMGLASRRGPALADEFVYLAGGRHLAAAGSLDARYYDAAAILERGLPHHDVHTPGYVIVLGAAMALAGATYAAAVAVNAAAYVASAVFVFMLARRLGQTEAAAALAALAFLLLPISLAYVYWAMAELVLGALFLGALAVAAGPGTRARAIAAGLVFGAAFLVRESALFGLPALLALLPTPRRRVQGAAAFLAFGLCVYAPLSSGRAPGGANFWAPSSGRAFGHRAVQSMGAGRIGDAASIAFARAAGNAGELVRAPAAEQAVLALYAALPFAALIGWRRRPREQRRYVLALAAGYAAMIGVLFALYVVAQWSGLRYLMVLAVAFLPAIAPPPGARRRDWTPAVVLTLAGALAQPGVVRAYDAYKASRQRRQENITAYVEQRVGTAPLTRIALVNGWHFGWRHPGVEVISSLPGDGGTLRALERAAWFDYLVLPGDSPLIAEWDARTRYEPVNAEEADAPLRLYRRVR
jgi:hypothetical protein